MKVMHYADAKAKSFNSDTVKGVTGRVLVGKDDDALNFCMRMFELAEDGYTPKHTHDWEHEIFFHSGAGEILCDNIWVPVKAGHVAFVPGNAEHQIRNTGGEPLIFICVIPSGHPEM